VKASRTVCRAVAVVNALLLQSYQIDRDISRQAPAFYRFGKFCNWETRFHARRTVRKLPFSSMYIL